MRRYAHCTPLPCPLYASVACAVISFSSSLVAGCCNCWSVMTSSCLMSWRAFSSQALIWLIAPVICAANARCEQVAQVVQQTVLLAGARGQRLRNLSKVAPIASVRRRKTGHGRRRLLGYKETAIVREEIAVLRIVVGQVSGLSMWRDGAQKHGLPGGLV